MFTPGCCKSKFQYSDPRVLNINKLVCIFEVQHLLKSKFYDMPEKIKYTLSFVIVVIIALLAYYGDYELVQRLSFALLSTALTALLFVVLSFRNSISSKIEEEVRPLIKAQEKVSIEREEDIKRLISSFDKQYEVAQTLVQQLSKDKQKDTYIGKLMRFSRFKSNVFCLGNTMLNEQITQVHITSYGFYVEGEARSLRLYTIFWAKMIEKQREINTSMGIDENAIPIINSNNQYDKARLIVRATHSNDINLFLGKEHFPYNDTVDEFLEKQRAFVNCGGIIERILLGREKEATTDYVEVIDRMKKDGIGIRYLPLLPSDKKAYDFAWVSSNEVSRLNESDGDTNFVAKWKSLQASNELGACEIFDGVETTIYRQWRTLGRRVEKGGDGFDKIPTSRQT